MIRPGLISVTFRKLKVEEVVALAVRAGLDSVEWGGDIHVPHGDLAKAKETARLTREAGLAVAGYGSYYRAGVSEPALPFSRVLDTAKALGAPLIRVWAGNHGSRHPDPTYRRNVVEDLARIVDMASAAGVGVALEYHGNTLTDTPESTVRLLEESGRSGLLSHWQPPDGAPESDCMAGLKAVLPRLASLHVFHWVKAGTGVERRPLVEGEASWRRYLAEASSTGRDHGALLEFVRDDAPEQFLKDAATLKGWLTRG